jgi:hypothetical protein
MSLLVALRDVSFDAQNSIADGSIADIREALPLRLT